MLTVSRCVHTVWYMYVMDCFAVTVTVVVFALVAAALQITPYIFKTSYNVSYIIQFSLLSSVFILVVAVNIVTLTKLNSSLSEDHDLEERKHTTLTVIILSTLYCISSIGNLVVLLASFTGEIITVPPLFTVMSTYIILPLKSASNPAVYMSKNREMRKWLGNIWKKLTVGGETSDKELEQFSHRDSLYLRKQHANRTYN